MPELSSYDYAIVRVVPSVERGEFVNAGVILFCRTRRFLRARIHLDEARLLALSPDIDLESVRHQLECIPLVCEGGKAAGPIGLLSQAERFHWLTAPRSTIIQPSPVHSGLTADPASALDHLESSMVLPPSAGQP
ncbi:MAG: DUF3037 domain-containing protein [Planctomycetaceae bacterium]|nr:MAG: DUF3037 domain-containing protein [Planctomycetaceae bacterium]